MFQENSFLLKAVSCSDLDILQVSECVSIFGIQKYIRAGIFPYLVSTQELYSSDQNPLSCAYCHVLSLGSLSPMLMLVAEASLQVLVLISKFLANNFIIKYDIGIKSGSLNNTKNEQINMITFKTSANIITMKKYANLHIRSM